MSIVQYRKVKCDNKKCGKETIIKNEGFSLPLGWLEINILEGKSGCGNLVFSAEVCSRKCALELMHSLRKIPERVYRI